MNALGKQGAFFTICMPRDPSQPNCLVSSPALMKALQMIPVVMCSNGKFGKPVGNSRLFICWVLGKITCDGLYSLQKPPRPEAQSLGEFLQCGEG